MSAMFETSCCGMYEYKGFFFEPEKVFKDMAQRFYWKDDYRKVVRKRGGAIVFNIVEIQNPKKYINYVKENKLGKIKVSDYWENPNTTNKIKTIIFVPNEAFLKLAGGRFKGLTGE